MIGRFEKRHDQVLDASVEALLEELQDLLRRPGCRNPQLFSAGKEFWRGDLPLLHPQFLFSLGQHHEVRLGDQDVLKSLRLEKWRSQAASEPEDLRGKAERAPSCPGTHVLIVATPLNIAFSFPSGQILSTRDEYRLVALDEPGTLFHADG